MMTELQLRIFLITVDVLLAYILYRRLRTWNQIGKWISSKEYRKQEFTDKWPDVTFKDVLYFNIGFCVALIAFGAIVIAAFNTINYLGGILLGVFIVIVAVTGVVWNVIKFDTTKKDKTLVDELNEKNAWM